MKRVWLGICACALMFAGMANAVTIATINDGTQSNCGTGCYQIGDKRFTNIALIGLDANEGSWGAANVGVIGTVGGDGTVFIEFNTPATAGDLGNPTTNPRVDFILAYTVTVVGGQLISTIDQHVTGTAGIANGFVQVGEVVKNSDNSVVLAKSNVFIPGDENDPNGEANDQLVLSTASNTVNVRKDVLLQAGDSTDRSLRITSVTSIQQSFHQIPEPMHYSLLLSGGLMLGLYFKSRKRSQA